MGDLRIRRDEAGRARIRNVPIAVTADGFWCCPSPAVIQKTLKSQNPQNNQRTSHQISTQILNSSRQKIQNHPSEKNPNTLRSRILSCDQRCAAAANVSTLSTSAATGAIAKPADNKQRKISVVFGQPETSDLKVILSGKEGIALRMSVHKNVLVENSSFFAEKFSRSSPVSFVEIGDCEDVDLYVETVGLMYCQDMKQRLIRHSVPRVLRILKIAESIGFHTCINICLGYLESVPWVGEEEDNVVSSLRLLQSNNNVVSPVLKRVFPATAVSPNNTLAQIIHLVLKSKEDKGRREMKSLVLKLLKENKCIGVGSRDMCADILYSSCRSCVESLLHLFRQATESVSSGKSSESNDVVTQQICIEVDNILWLLDIMIDRHVAGEFTSIWASQDELANLHSKLYIVSRHLVSCITGKIFVAIGRGLVLPSQTTRLMLLELWLQPLIDDYNWLQHGCRPFDQKLVEEGIGQTILTLPLEDQQRILMSWFGSFLKIGDRCPNLQRAFEVWWKRTFLRPCTEQMEHIDHDIQDGIVSFEKRK